MARFKSMGRIPPKVLAKLTAQYPNGIPSHVFREYTKGQKATATNKFSYVAWLQTLDAEGITRPTHGDGCTNPELKFHATRKWRFDWAWPELMVALEMNGGHRMAQGRHTWGTGYENDLEKINTAQEMGWVVLQFVPGHMFRPSTLKLIKDTLASKAPTNP